MKELKIKVTYLKTIIKALQEVIIGLSNKINVFSRIVQQDIRTIDLEIKTRNNKNIDK